jgi:hypothetical protein
MTMNRNHRTPILFAAALFTLTLGALAPSATHAARPSLREALASARQKLIDLRSGAAVDHDLSVAPLVRVEPEAARLDTAAARRLVGTWRVHVPGEDPSQDFDAFHSFHADGTFTENSTLHPTLTEGPAQGVWADTAGGLILTFQLFFYEDKVPLGRIRVRNRIELTGPNSFVSHSTVDILPNGEAPILGVATGDFFGVRVGLVAP